MIKTVNNETHCKTESAAFSAALQMISSTNRNVCRLNSSCAAVSTLPSPVCENLDSLARGCRCCRCAQGHLNNCVHCLGPLSSLLHHPCCSVWFIPGHFQIWIFYSRAMYLEMHHFTTVLSIYKLSSHYGTWW